MTPARRRRTAKRRHRAKRLGAGLAVALLGCPALGQVEPAEPLLVPPAEAPAGQPPAAAAPASPAPTRPLSPFELRQGIYPTGVPTAPTVTPPAVPPNPFETVPGVYPDLNPAPAETAAPPASPFELAPGVFPGLAPTLTAPAAVAPGQPAPGAPGQPATPAEAAPGVFPGVPTVPAAELAPLAPQYGFGNFAPDPRITPIAPITPLSPATPLSTVQLRPLIPGAAPVQQLDPRAPPVIIIPSVTLGEGYTDNPRNTPSTLSDSVSRFGGAALASVDTVRLQGQLNGSINYYKYARAPDEDKLSANMFGYGLGTVVRDHVFVDARAAITQLSRAGGVAFASPSVIPPSQESQAIAVSMSPFVRQSIDGWVDGELRYTYGLNLFQNGSLLSNSSTTSTATTVPSASLSNATRNEGTLSLATGRRFTFFGSKLTLDATQIDSQSAAKSTQLRGYDDVEYEFNREITALARVGFESLDYPLQPTVSTTGPLWLIGGRYTPFPDAYLFLRYGKMDGFYGIDGALRYALTPATILLASLDRNLSSSQEQILNNLNTSQVDAYGNVVDQITGLPTALANPEFAYTANNIYRHERGRAGVQTHLGRDTYGAFAFLDHRTVLGTNTATTGVAQTLSGSDTTLGINVNWNHALTAYLTSLASLGYATERTAHLKTLTADWRLTYILSEKLNAVLHYQLINVNGTIAGSSYRRNQVELAVTRTF